MRCCEGSSVPGLIGTALRALPLLGFLMLVCLGFLGFLAIPAVGEALGPLTCAADERMVSQTSSYSLPGRHGTSVTYFCEGPGGARPMGFFDTFLAGLKVYVLFFLVVVWPLVTLRRYRRAARELRLKERGIPATARILAARPTSWRINGRPVVELELEVAAQGHPPATKRVRRPIPELLMPHIQPGMVLHGLADPENPQEVMIDFSRQAEAGSAQRKGGTEQQPRKDGSVEALRALKTMLEEGLIDAGEYELKKQQILGRM